MYALAIVLVGVGTYWNSQSGVFLLDDFASIHHNPTIRELWPIWGPLSPPGRGVSVAGRPIVNLSLALNYSVGGLDVRGYHLFNIGIHIACALLVMGIVRRSLHAGRETRSLGTEERSREIAAACATLWMVHPLQSEAANYIVARTESTMAFCYLLSLYAAIRAHASASSRDRAIGWGLWTTASVAACGVGMACKESMATAPIAIALFDRAVLFPTFRDAFRARWRLYLGLAATWIVLALLVASGPRGGSAGFSSPTETTAEVTSTGYLVNQAVMITRYLRLFVWPDALVLDYGHPRSLEFGEVWLHASLVGALSVAAVALWYVKPLWGLPLVGFLLTLAPTSLIPIVTQVGAERRMYLPGVFLVIAIVIAGWRLGLRGRASVVALVALAAVLSAVTIVRNTEYLSAYGMWRTVVDRWPHGRAYLNLATEAQAMGKTDEIIPLLRQAVRDLPDAEYPLGARLYAAGSYEEAIEHLQAFLHARSTHHQAGDARTLLIQSWTDLGIARAKGGSLKAAIDAFEQALTLDPSKPDLHRNLANALLDSGDAAGAERHAQEALARRPDDQAAMAILEEARQLQHSRAPR